LAGGTALMPGLAEYFSKREKICGKLVWGR